MSFIFPVVVSRIVKMQNSANQYHLPKSHPFCDQTSSFDQTRIACREPGISLGDHIGANALPQSSSSSLPPLILFPLLGVEQPILETMESQEA